MTEGGRTHRNTRLTRSVSLTFSTLPHSISCFLDRPGSGVLAAPSSRKQVATYGLRTTIKSGANMLPVPPQTGLQNEARVDGFSARSHTLGQIHLQISVFRLTFAAPAPRDATSVFVFFTGFPLALIFPYHLCPQGGSRIQRDSAAPPSAPLRDRGVTAVAILMREDSRRNLLPMHVIARIRV